MGVVKTGRQGRKKGVYVRAITDDMIQYRCEKTGMSFSAVMDECAIRGTNGFDVAHKLAFVEEQKKQEMSKSESDGLLSLSETEALPKALQTEYLRLHKGELIAREHGRKMIHDYSEDGQWEQYGHGS
jgi:hypothetical protein